MKKTTFNKIPAFLLSLLISLGFGAACLKIPSLSQIISSKGNINLLTYAMTVVLFCLLFLVICLAASRLHSTDSRQQPMAAFLLALILLAGNLSFLLIMFRLEVNVYGSASARYVWHNVPFWLVCICIVAENIFFISLVRKSSIHLKNTGLFSLYGMLTLLTAYNFYTPAVFLRDEPDRLHMDAYFNSVYNVLHGQPYTEFTTSIYGHYGIFYKFPLKILGGDLIDFILLNSIIGGLCFLAMFLALHFIVKNDLLRILGSVAMTLPILSMRSGNYWQLWPHRILFMSLMLCFMAFCVRFQKLNRITCILGYLLAMAATLWNTESGLFCAVAWAGFWILRHLCQGKKKLSEVLLCIIGHLFGIVLSFLGAWGIVECYNLFSGGTVQGIHEFLFPLLQSSYMDDLLRVDLPDFPSAYIPILALLLLAVANGIAQMWIFHKDEIIPEKDRLISCYVFATGVLALGQMTYFINRAAYHNLEICHLPCILLLCILAEKGIKFVQEFRFSDIRTCQSSQICQGAFTLTALIVLFTLCSGNLIQYGTNTSLRQQLHNKTDLRDFAAHIAANIPENTYAFGIGVPEIYAILRWDTQCYTLDFPDLSLRPQVGDYVMDDIREKDLPGFLAGEGTTTRMKKYSSSEKYQWLMQHYEVSQTFEFQGAELTYYTRKKGLN